MGSGGINPLILNLGTRCRWVVSFPLRPFYPSPHTHWTGDWVGTQSRSGHSGDSACKNEKKKKNSRPFRESNRVRLSCGSTLTRLMEEMLAPKTFCFDLRTLR